jgi:spore germination protein YaaH
VGKKIIFSLVGLLLGIGLAYFLVLRPSLFSLSTSTTKLFEKSPERTKEVIGFLPYWLIGKAKVDYSPFITNLSYFALTADTDGTIMKLTSPIEAEPGWYALNSGKIDPFLSAAKKNNVDLSLTVFNGDRDMIDEIVSDPVTHAANLAEDVIPVMKEHGFKELNLDIESTKDASDEARENFTTFMKELKNKLKGEGVTMTVDITGMDLLKKNLIDPKSAGEIADHVLVMTYDFHYPGSFVTGAVAPLGGAGVTAEYDVTSAIEKAKAVIPSQKILLGVPLYGYEWETISNAPHAGVIPGTGITASNSRIEELIATCSTCSASFDETSMESYIIYKDTEMGTFHQLFYPGKDSTLAKSEFASQQNLGGIGLWALGYEGKDILNPLRDYIK